MMKFLDNIGLRFRKYQQIIWLLIFVQALVGMLGSLYYSTFGDPVSNLQTGNLFPSGSVGFEPCLLCWYARILLYPVVFISAIGILKKDRKFTDYVLPLVVPGIFIEIYHYSLQKLPIVTILKCTEANPCSALDVNYFGFITIPLLAFVAFLVMTKLCVLNMLINRQK